METIYTKMHDENIKKIKAELAKSGEVKVVNSHETFYGWGFDKWLKKGLSDTRCTIETIGYDKFEGFPSEFIIKSDR